MRGSVVVTAGAAPEQDEAGRVAALLSLHILDTAPDAEFDALVRAASLICRAPLR